MANSDFSSSGGGSNYQCLPEDPSYSDKTTSNVPGPTLRAVKYAYVDTNVFGKHLIKHRVPCAVCETNKRVAQLMIPAQTKCPSSDWSLEYRGYVMSEADSSERGSTSYICVDENPESLTTNSSEVAEDWNGGFLYPVTVACSGRGNIYNCPPYRSDRSALSCVVCSK